MRLVYTEKASEAVEKLVESRRDTYQTVLDHAVGLQERNVRFAQGLVDTSIKEFHHQAESNRSVLGELFERAEQQRGASQVLVEQSFDGYTNFAYAPFSYYREGLKGSESG